MKRYLWIPLLLLIFAVPAGLFLACRTYQSQSIKECTFIIDCDFERARKVMVRTDAGDQLLTACGRRIIDKQIDSIDIGTDKIIHGNWEVNYQNHLVVEASNPLGGTMMLPLWQKACVRPDRLVSASTLTRPTGCFQEQQATIDMRQHGNKTLVMIKLTVTLRFVAPRWPGIQEDLEKRLAAGVDNAVCVLRDSMVHVVQERKGQQKLFLKIK